MQAVFPPKGFFVPLSWCSGQGNRRIWDAFFLRGFSNQTAFLLRRQRQNRVGLISAEWGGNLAHLVRLILECDKLNFKEHILLFLFTAILVELFFISQVFYCPWGHHQFTIVATYHSITEMLVSFKKPALGLHRASTANCKEQHIKAVYTYMAHSWRYHG